AEKTVRLLKQRGVEITVREKLPAAPMEALRVIFRAVSLDDAEIRNGADFEKKRHLLTKTYADFLEPGLKLTLREYLDAQTEVTTFLEESAPEYWKDCDILAMPTLAVPPFSTDLPLGPERVAEQKIDPQLEWAFTWPFNL